MLFPLPPAHPDGGCCILSRIKERGQGFLLTAEGVPGTIFSMPSSQIRSGSRLHTGSEFPHSEIDGKPSRCFFILNDGAARRFMLDLCKATAIVAFFFDDYIVLGSSAAVCCRSVSMAFLLYIIESPAFLGSCDGY